MDPSAASALLSAGANLDVTQCADFEVLVHGDHVLVDFLGADKRHSQHRWVHAQQEI